MRSGLRAALAAAAVGLCGLLPAACGRPSAPEHPTWVDVEPIIAGQCAGCHGATADTTGSGVRFDFYDVGAATCGDAAKATDGELPMAGGLATRIWEAVSTTSRDVRPLMPPQPAPSLQTWEWQTIQRWVSDGAPRGDLPRGNRPPGVVFFPSDTMPDRTLDITALVEDPDGDPVIGVLKLAGALFRMDHGGAFSAHLDTSSWAPGDLAVTAVLCDGWSSVTYPLGTLTVRHGEP